ncbi:hypothetical protein Tco_0360717 [Tanacetum coccineum]
MDSYQDTYRALHDPVMLFQFCLTSQSQLDIAFAKARLQASAVTLSTSPRSTLSLDCAEVLSEEAFMIFSRASTITLCRTLALSLSIAALSTLSRAFVNAYSRALRILLFTTIYFFPLPIFNSFFFNPLVSSVSTVCS